MSVEKYAPVQRKLLALHDTMSWALMSAECGINATTIKRFACGDTARPQFRTVDLLADYAGFRMEIKDLQLNTVFKLRRIK